MYLVLNLPRLLQIENLRTQLMAIKGGHEGENDEATTTVAANTIQRYE